MNVVDSAPEWLHVWTPSIHDEVARSCCSADAGAAAASCLLQVVELNWSNQPYQIVHGTRITLLNNTFVSQGQPFPPAAQVNAGGVVVVLGLTQGCFEKRADAAAQAVIAAAGVTWMAGPKQ